MATGVIRRLDSLVSSVLSIRDNLVQSIQQLDSTRSLHVGQLAEINQGIAITG